MSLSFSYQSHDFLINVKQTVWTIVAKISSVCVCLCVSYVLWDLAGRLHQPFDLLKVEDEDVRHQESQDDDAGDGHDHGHRDFCLVQLVFWEKHTKKTIHEKNYVFLDKKTQKVSRGPEWRGGKQYEEGTQSHSGEKKSKWKKTPFSLNIVVKLKFFYHFKKKFFPQEEENT